MTVKTEQLLSLETAEGFFFSSTLSDNSQYSSISLIYIFFKLWTYIWDFQDLKTSSKNNITQQGDETKRWWWSTASNWKWSIFSGDVLIIITSQKYEACVWQTLGLQRQTIFCSVKRCYLPSLLAYDLNRGSPLRFMHRHKHPNKRTLSTHTHLSGERHFVMCPYEHQHSHTYVKTCLSETLAGCCCPRQNGGFSLVVSTWSHSVQSIKRLCVLLQNDWPLKMPRWGYSQSVFWTFSGFFWTFWWTTFTVVRKFPRNRTRNVRASMNT